MIPALFLRICSCWTMYSMRFGLYWHTSNADRYVLPVPVAEIIIARLSPCLRSCTRFINASTCMAFGVMAALESLLCLRFGWRGGAYCLKSSSYNASQASVSGLDSLICESISSSSCRARPLWLVETTLRFHSRLEFSALMVRFELPKHWWSYVVSWLPFLSKNQIQDTTGGDCAKPKDWNKTTGDEVSWHCDFFDDK